MRHWIPTKTKPPQTVASRQRAQQLGGVMVSYCTAVLAEAMAGQTSKRLPEELVSVRLGGGYMVVLMGMASTGLVEVTSSVVVGVAVEAS